MRDSRHLSEPDMLRADRAKVLEENPSGLGQNWVRLQKVASKSGRVFSSFTSAAVNFSTLRFRV